MKNSTAKPKVTIASLGEEGNIYFIVMKVKQALKEVDQMHEFEPLCAKVFASQSYTEAIGHIRAVCDLCDLDGKI